MLTDAFQILYAIAYFLELNEQLWIEIYLIQSDYLSRTAKESSSFTHRKRKERKKDLLFTKMERERERD